MQKLQSGLRLATLLALSSVAISACASSPAKIPPPDSEPIVAPRLETRTVCPIELVGPIPAKVPRPAEAVVAGNEAGLLYVGARFGREDALDQLIADAAQACRPAPAGPPPDPG